MASMTSALKSMDRSMYGDPSLRYSIFSPLLLLLMIRSSAFTEDYRPISKKLMTLKKLTGSEKCPNKV